MRGSWVAFIISIICLSIVLMISLSLSFASYNTCEKNCGNERWAIKTCLDRDASKINTTPIGTSIAEMRDWKRPQSKTQDRISPYEFNTYTITTIVTGYRLEKDKDIHLILSNDSGKTIIGEIPNPNCAKNSRFYNDIKWTYEYFTKTRRVTRNLKQDSLKVKITGVAFFDYIHGQDGVAPNGIELHPIIKIEVIQ